MIQQIIITEDTIPFTIVVDDRIIRMSPCQLKKAVMEYMFNNFEIDPDSKEFNLETENGN